MRRSTMLEATTEPETQPDTAPLRVWAEKAGHLPEQLKGDRIHPRRHNLQSWIPRAVCALHKMDLDSPITEQTYNDAAAAVAKAEAR